MAGFAALRRNQVTLTCRSVDRIFLQAYVPRLQTAGMVCQFLRWQRGFVIPSSAAFARIGDACVAEVDKFAKANAIPLHHCARGEKKEEIARPHIGAAARQGHSAVALIGIARDKATRRRSSKARGQESATHPHMEWGRQTALASRYYFCLWDAEWGPACWKTSATPRGRSGCGCYGDCFIRGITLPPGICTELGGGEESAGRSGLRD